MKMRFSIKIASLFLATFLLFSMCITAVSAAEMHEDTAVAAQETPDEINSSLPSYYSSPDLGYVMEIKSQRYQDCWAYACLATLETFLLKLGYHIGNMSIEHLNVWASTRTDGKGWLREYWDSGYPSIALGYLTAWQGAVAEKDLKDVDIALGDYGDTAPTGLARYGVTAAKYLTQSGIEEIKQAVYDNGAVFTSYAQSSLCMSRDRLSYFMPPDYAGSYEGHSISVVGWDDNYSRDNFTGSIGAKPSHDGAWLIKNSWGDNNELGGYFWMSYEDKWVFSDKYTPSYTIQGAESLNPYIKLIQNEIYGATYEFGYIPSDDLTFINRLQFDSDYEMIDKVVFESTAVGAAYTLYFVPDGTDDTPDTDTTHWTMLDRGTVDYKGYICVDIEDFRIPEGGGSLAVQIDATAIDGNSTLGVGEWLTNNSKLVFLNDSQRGESYIMHDGVTEDLLDWYQRENNDDMGGTFVIKAITAKEKRPSLVGDADEDGIISIYDVTEMQRHLAEYIKLEGTAALNTDFNFDGEITIDDATAIQRMLAELED